MKIQGLVAVVMKLENKYQWRERTEQCHLVSKWETPWSPTVNAIALSSLLHQQVLLLSVLAIACLTSAHPNICNTMWPQARQDRDRAMGPGRRKRWWVGVCAGAERVRSVGIRLEGELQGATWCSSSGCSWGCQSVGMSREPLGWEQHVIKQLLLSSRIANSRLFFFTNCKNCVSKKVWLSIKCLQIASNKKKEDL